MNMKHERINVTAQLGDDEGRLMSHQARDEMHVAGQSIQLGHDDRGLVVFLGDLQRRCELWPAIQCVGALAGLYLRECLDHVEAFDLRKPSNRGLLRCQP